MLRSLQHSVQQITKGSFIYDWRLRGHTPDRLIIRPVDSWAGDAEAGRWLCDGAFAMEGDQLALRGECWEPLGVSKTWLKHMHGFSWLRDLRALGGEQAREQGRAMAYSWIRHYERWHRFSWKPCVAGERIASWISHYDFFFAGADEFFQDEFFNSIIRQARHLRRSLPGEMHGLSLLKAIKGLLFAGVAFEGYEAWIAQSLTMLSEEIDAQILSDGSHVSRSPAQALEALRILLDIRGALHAAAYPFPEKAQHAIDRLGPALKFFRYADKHFAMFNGTQEGAPSLIDAVLVQAGASGKALNSLPAAGFERVSQGRTLLMFDCGKTPAWPHDQKAHAAPLSFELSYGKERVFVSCGSHPTSDEWQDALRATQAHNALCIDDRNACEIGEDGHFQRRAKVSSSLREDGKNACLVEATHDGYLSLNGMTHRRRLFLTDHGHDLRGEDMLSSSIAPAKPLNIVIRFHIHPRVLVSLIQDGHEALLRLPTGIGWRFHQSGGVLALEDSVYMGQGARPRKTKQLAIYMQVDSERAKVKWALQREGL